MLLAFFFGSGLAVRLIEVVFGDYVGHALSGLWTIFWGGFFAALALVLLALSFRAIGAAASAIWQMVNRSSQLWDSSTLTTEARTIASGSAKSSRDCK